MTICVIGLGSMGKRRIRLLRRFANMSVVGVDSQKTRRLECTEMLHIHTYESFTEAACREKLSCAFVCTSPLSHADIIHDCLAAGLHVFTEINLSADRYEENIALAREKGLTLFLSSTPLYRAEMRWVIGRVHAAKYLVNYMYHVGQYLPDWHPWEMYHSYFISDKRTNGCRELLAIELPWLVNCFGAVENATVLRGRNTTLDIDYDDNYMLQLQHRSGAKGALAIDVMSRKASRRLEVYGEDTYITWNGTPDSLMEFDIETQKERFVTFEKVGEHHEGYADFIVETPYEEEIKSFFNLVMNPDTPCLWDFERDRAVLTLIDQIEGHTS